MTPDMLARWAIRVRRFHLQRAPRGRSDQKTKTDGTPGPAGSALTDLMACAGGVGGSAGSDGAAPVGGVSQGGIDGTAGNPVDGVGDGGGTGAAGLPGLVRMSFAAAPSMPVPTAVPTMGEWALKLLSAALAGLAGKRLRRTRVG
ncbi:MAG: IPTL-CTERM sorting domain-containing protein [Ottowia sp.]